MATFVGITDNPTKDSTSADVTVTPTVGNNLIVFAHAWDNNTWSDITISDDEGNTWSEDQQNLNISGNSQHCLVAHLNDVPTYTTSIVITVSTTGGGANTWWRVVCLEYSGGDFTLSASGNSGEDGTSPYPGYQLTGSDLTVASWSHEGAHNRVINLVTSPSGGGTWVERGEGQDANQGQPFNAGDSTSSGTIQPEWTQANNVTGYSSTVTYSEAGGDVNVDLIAIAATTTMDATSESGKANETLGQIGATTAVPQATIDIAKDVALSELATAAFVPAISDRMITTTAIQVTTTMDTPTVEAETPADVDLLELDTAVFISALSVSGQGARAPPAIATSTTLDAPAVTGDVNVTLTAIAVSAEVPIPTVETSTPASVTLLELATSIGMDAVSVAGEAAVTSDEIATTADLPLVTVEAGGGVNVDLTAIVTSVTMDAATATGEAATALAAIAATIDVPAATINTEASITSAAIAATTTMDAASISAEVAITSDDLLVTTNIPTWAVAVEAGLQPIAATATLQTAVTAGVAAVTSDEIAVTADLPIVTVQAGGGVNVNLAEIAASVTMDTAAVSAAMALTTTAIATSATLEAVSPSGQAAVSSDEIAVTSDLPLVVVEAGGSVNVNLSAIAVVAFIPEISDRLTNLSAIATTAEVPLAAAGESVEVNLSSIAVVAFVPEISDRLIGLSPIDTAVAVPQVSIQVPGAPVNVNLTAIHVQFKFWSWDFDVQFGGTIVSVTTGGSQTWVYPEAIPGQFTLPTVTAIGYKDFEAAGVGEGTGSGVFALTEGDMVATGTGVGIGRVITDLVIEFVDPLDTDEINTSPYNVIVRAYNWRPTVTVVFVVDDELPWAVMGAYFHESGEIRWNYAWATEDYTGSIDLDTHMLYGSVPASLDRASVQPISGVALDMWSDSITVTKGNIDMVASGTGVGTGYAAMFDTKELGFAAGSGIGTGSGSMFGEVDMYAIGVGVGTGTLYVRFDYQRGVGVSTTRPPSVSSDTAVPSVRGEEPSSVDADAQQSRVEVDDG